MVKVFLVHQAQISSLPPMHFSFTVGSIFLTNESTIISCIRSSKKQWTSIGHAATHIQTLESEQNTHTFNCDLWIFCKYSV